MFLLKILISHLTSVSIVSGSLTCVNIGSSFFSFLINISFHYWISGQTERTATPSPKKGKKLHQIKLNSLAEQPKKGTGQGRKQILTSGIGSKISYCDLEASSTL